MSEVHDACKYATFYIDDLYFGIEVKKVQEVIRYQKMTPVPLSPRIVSGLINLRGQIVTALDTRYGLGLGAPHDQALPVNVILNTDDSVVSLLVDEIGDVIDASISLRVPVPDNMPPQRKELIECIFDLPSGLMLVLDTSRLLQNACN